MTPELFIVLSILLSLTSGALGTVAGAYIGAREAAKFQRELLNQQLAASKQGQEDFQKFLEEKILNAVLTRMRLDGEDLRKKIASFDRPMSSERPGRPS